jgi:hypothetical protein
MERLCHDHAGSVERDILIHMGLIRKMASCRHRYTHGKEAAPNTP